MGARVGMRAACWQRLHVGSMRGPFPCQDCPYQTAGPPRVYFPGWDHRGNYERGVLYGIDSCWQNVLPYGSRSYSIWDYCLCADPYADAIEGYDNLPDREHLEWANSFVPRDFTGIFETDEIC